MTGPSLPRNTKTELSSERQKVAAKRAADARRDAKYHAQQAAAAIAKAEQIERTWQLPAPRIDCGAQS